MQIHSLIIAGLVALVVAGAAVVFLGGDSEAKKRQAALLKSGPKARDNVVEKNARKKQISDSLKELDRKTAKKKVSIEGRIMQAGLTFSLRQYIIFAGICGVAVAFLMYLLTHKLVIAAPAFLIGAFGVPNFLLGRLVKRRINKFVNEFPNAMDVIVRGIKSGLPLGDCLRIIANEAAEPVKSEFRYIVETQAMGLSLGEAVQRIAERVPVTETNFFSIVINIQEKAGGNLSEALGNLSRVLRERKKMKGKIAAMAMEAKASAYIIGAVPFVVTTLLYLTSPDYVSLLWTTQRGLIISGIAMCWMGCGIMMMKKMISFDF